MKFFLHNLLSFITFAAILTSATASGADFKNSSVLADGSWFKVKVTEAGVQRISYDTLREWGFNHPERVAVYGYGSVEASMQLATAPDDLPQVAVMHRDGSLYFYGETDLRVNVNSAKSITAYRNYYSYGSHYFLTEDAPALAVAADADAVSPDADAENLTTTHTSLIYHEPEEHNPTLGGVFWYSEPVKSGSSITVNFDMQGYAGSATLGYLAIAKNPINAFQPEIKGSDNVAFSSTGSIKIPRSSDVKEYYARMQAPNTTSFTLSGSSKASFTLGIPSSEADNTDFLCLDAMWVIYSRLNEMPADGSQLLMHYIRSGMPASLTATGKAGDIIVWNVTDPRNTSSLPCAAVDGRLTFGLPQSSVPVKVVAFDPSSSRLSAPEAVGEVKNTNIHALSGLDMIIVAPESMMAAGERLARIHSSAQGLNVAVVDKADVFNEFSSGSFTANSIRLMTKMLHRRDSRLKYLLLLGAGNYDNRSVASDTNPYLPTYQIEGVDNAKNIAKALTCDMYFGSIEDNLYPDITTRVEPATPRVIDVAVGRLPVMISAEADAVIDKIEAYMADPSRAGFLNRALIMADKGNKNQHMKGSESVVENIAATTQGMTYLKGYQAAFPNIGGINGKNSSLHKFTASAIAGGPSFIYYAGHGSPSCLFSDVFFNINYVERLHFKGNPLMFLASCFPYCFDYNYRGLATDMLFNRDNGPIAVIAPGREVYLTANQAFSDIFASHLYSCPQGSTVGDVLRSSLNEMLYGSMLNRTNALNFNLGGDPAVPLPRRGYEAVVTSSTGKFIPGVKTRIEGEIRDADGNRVDSFNGTITIEIFDTPRQFLSYVNSSDDNDSGSRMTLDVDHTVISSASCRVEGGKWTTEITLPDIANIDSSNRLALCAIPDAGFDFATGSAATSIGDADPSAATPDASAPELTLEIVDASTTSGEIETGRTPSVKVTVSDDGSGVFFSDAAIGGKLKMLLDSRTNLENVATMLTTEGDGVYSAIYPLGTLADGRHTIQASVKDNAGNLASASIEFVVVEPGFDCSIAVDSDIVGDKAVFTLIHHLSSTPEARIVIEDLAGNHVTSRSISGDTFEWDLTDADGNPVADGSYNVYAIVKSHPRFSSTAKTSFTVIR